MPVIIAAISAAVILTTLITVKILSRNTLKIAFYDIPDSVKNSLQKNIQSIDNKKIKFETLDKKKSLSKSAAKNYSIIFAPHSLSLKELAPLSAHPEAVTYLPQNIQKSTRTLERSTESGGVELTVSNYALPVLLDHFELAVYRTYKNDLSLAQPQTLDALNDYLKTVKSRASYPLIVIGSDDAELWGFVSALSQSIYSAEEYNNLCRDLYQAQKTNSELPYNLRLVLDKLKYMQRHELIHPKWTRLTKADAEYLMKEHSIGALACYLSTHREMSYVLIKYYDSFIFPQGDVKSNFGVIIPEFCAMTFNRNDKLNQRSQNILTHLATAESQAELSKNTLLSPAASFGESADSIADDVRFYAAASPSGPLMPMSLASFENPSQMHKYADLIRSYIEF
ncbi:hypothetical protein [Treponema sp.]|uniref:hypothetical protein n=1 Tax=Treponema sp. TaxID=166 RepID=UPI00298EBE00|nr:hypothetical protein [Treponema sp.]MCR5614524.1 hypothetical protein [Treponema sp.]